MTLEDVTDRPQNLSLCYLILMRGVQALDLMTAHSDGQWLDLYLELLALIGS